MAVYRSDQAQVTFGTEYGAHGGYTEAATDVNVASNDVARLTENTPAGTRTLAVDNNTSQPIVAGDFIQIGPTTASGSELFYNTEVRRAEYVEATAITLDSPTGFFHPDNTNITACESITDNDEDKFITWVPGVYETVDVPDPEMAIEGRYLLGTNQKRNFFVAYKGQQTFQGSIGGFVLLNGWPLRYSVGSVTSIPSVGTTGISYLEQDASNDSPKKGDYWIKTAAAGALAPGDQVVIGYKSAANLQERDRCEIRRITDVNSTTYFRINYPLQFDHPAGTDEQVCTLNDGSGVNTSVTTFTVDAPILHGDRSGTAISDAIEVGDYLLIGSEVVLVTNNATSATTITATRAQQGTTAASHSDNAAMYRVTPIHEIDTATADLYYQHDIREKVDLDTVSWHVHMRDSEEQANRDFDRRYFGGHIGSTTITAEEGGLLTASWDSVTFKDMIHNQKSHSGFSGAGGVPGYTLLQSIEAKDVGVPLKTGTYSSNIDSMSGGGFPSTEPYYFSQGELTMFGVTFARVRSFSLSINNGEEARYYIGGQGKGTRRHRGPTEIRETQREYSMSATIGLPDSHIADGVPYGTVATSKRLFTELLLEGDYGATTSSMTGLSVVLTFTRGANDTITFTVPGSSGGSSAGTAAAGGGKQGAFIRSAPHTLSGDNPFQVDVDILFRNLDIQIKDSEAYYP